MEKLRTITQRFQKGDFVTTKYDNKLFKVVAAWEGNPNQIHYTLEGILTSDCYCPDNGLDKATFWKSIKIIFMRIIMITCGYLLFKISKITRNKFKISKPILRELNQKKISKNVAQ